jgi:hypothetical protein
MKIKRYLLFLFFNCLALIALSQSSSQTTFYMPPIANYQNVQQQNPAAFNPQDLAWLQVQGKLNAAFPSLQNWSLDFKTKQQQFYLDQHFSLQGIRTYQELRCLSNVGLELNSYLKVGVGLGFQTLLQPTFYGNKWTASARFGLQLECTSHDFLSFGFEWNAAQIQNAMNWAYLHELSSALCVFADLKWALNLPPQLQFGCSQQLQNYRLTFYGCILPQRYGFMLEKNRQQLFTWAMGLNWQAKIGTSLQWTIQIKHK